MGKESMNIKFFTANFPYTKSEAYIENEIPIMASNANSVTIFPLAGFDDAELRETPENFKIEQLAEKVQTKLKLRDYLLLAKILLLELYYSNKKKYFLMNLRSMISRLKKAFLMARQLEHQGAVNSQDLYYSYWMNEWATVLLILKIEKKITHFIFRCGGFDIWDERSPGDYLPFRGIIYKYCSGVFPNSKQAEIYLKEKKLFAEKVNHKYWGTVDHGMAPFEKEEVFTIVSCSNVIPLKRINLIIDVLESIKEPIKWIHFGDGAELENISNYAKKIMKHHDVKFTGLIHNSEIYDFYKNNTVHLFITTSETEGLPVSIQEVISFGIPVIATNVGGMAEVVTDETGILIPAEVDIEKTAKIILDFKTSQKNSLPFRNGVREYWSKKFEADTIYQEFYTEIKKLVQ
jgi:glycosyltransferase involved in cell wall biosynthesis